MDFETQGQTFTISPEFGFKPLAAENVTGHVFEKDGMVYKLTDRNPVARLRSDIAILKSRFGDRIPDSKIVPCMYGGKPYTAVIQPKINGRELKKVGRQGTIELLKEPGNRAFIEALLKYFFTSIENKELYPDIVGFPDDPDFFNAGNLMVDDATGRILMCDVGLSPHQDTVDFYGKKIYESDNVKTYTAKMREFEQVLNGIRRGPDVVYL